MSPIPTTTSATTATTGANATAVTGSSVEADKNMFLQLMVAQLQNQDPLNPTDSSTFVTQLAQFQQLESTVNMGQDVSQIRSDADQFLAGYNNETASGAGTSQTTKP